jgi:type VI secretion system VasD/TssJ family lipoprotein
MIVPFYPLPCRAAFALVALGALSACATPPEKPLPVNKTLVVEAGPRINEYNNAANPIVLRLYQLSSRSEIEGAGFWDIFNEADERLAGAIIDRVSCRLRGAAVSRCDPH